MCVRGEINCLVSSIDCEAVGTDHICNRDCIGHLAHNYNGKGGVSEHLIEGEIILKSQLNIEGVRPNIA